MNEDESQVRDPAMFVYEMLSYNIAVLDWACRASYNGKSKYDQ